MSSPQASAVKSPADKMGIRQGTRSMLVGAPENVEALLGLPSIDRFDALDGTFAYLHLFATTQEALDRQFPLLKTHLATDGMFWVSWPKNRQMETDLTLPVVIEIGYRHGLVESRTISLDAVWSAIKFTHPITGRTYHNSYGTLATTR